MNELKLADLGEGMREAEIVEWLVKEGESVKLDQPVVRVETDKAIVEIPSPVAGRVSEIRFQPGQTAQVGEVLLVYDALQSTNGDKINATPGKVSQRESVSVAPALESGAVSSSQPASTGTVSTTPSDAASAKRRVLAAPAVRKLAFELGIDLTAVTPTAANGRVSMEDVRSYV